MEAIIMISVSVACVAVLICGLLACALYVKQLPTRRNESAAGCSQSQAQAETQTQDMEQGLRSGNKAEPGRDQAVTQEEWKWKCSARECAICLEELKNGEDCKVLMRCNHVYHVGCIDNWLAKNKHCPICRISVRGSPSRRASQDNTSNPVWTDFSIRHVLMLVIC